MPKRIDKKQTAIDRKQNVIRIMSDIDFHNYDLMRAKMEMLGIKNEATIVAMAVKNFCRI